MFDCNRNLVARLYDPAGQLRVHSVYFISITAIFLAARSMAHKLSLRRLDFDYDETLGAIICKQKVCSNASFTLSANWHLPPKVGFTIQHKYCGGKCALQHPWMTFEESLPICL